MTEQPITREELRELAQQVRHGATGKTRATFVTIAKANEYEGRPGGWIYHPGRTEAVAHGWQGLADVYLIGAAKIVAPADMQAQQARVAAERKTAERVPAEMLAGGALELTRELLAAADHDEQPAATVETPIAWRGAPEWRPCGPECMGWCLLVDAPCDAARTAAAPTLNDFDPADECDGADRPADAPTGDDGIAAAAGRILGLRAADDLDRAALLELVMRYRDARVADADALLEVIRQRLGTEPLGTAAAAGRPDCGRMPGRTHDQCTHDALVIMSSRGPISTASLPAGVVGWLVGDGLAQAADAAGSTLELTDEGGRAAGRVRARMTAAAAG